MLPSGQTNSLQRSSHLINTSNFIIREKNSRWFGKKHRNKWDITEKKEKKKKRKKGNDIILLPRSLNIDKMNIFKVYTLGKKKNRCHIDIPCFIRGHMFSLKNPCVNPKWSSLWVPAKKCRHCLPCVTFCWCAAYDLFHLSLRHDKRFASMRSIWWEKAGILQKILSFLKLGKVSTLFSLCFAFTAFPVCLLWGTRFLWKTKRPWCKI